MKKRSILGGLSMVLFALAWGAYGQEPPRKARAKTFGISQDSIYHVPITDFVPFDGFVTISDAVFGGVLSRYTTNCGGICLYAIPRLPDGALLTGIEAYFCNTNPDSSGITAGCGGGNYCPDSPLTRGQMAVFLAKAL